MGKEVEEKVMFKLKTLLCLILMLVCFITPVFADGTGLGGSAGTADRVAGVRPGLYAIYDRENFGSRSTVNLTVFSVVNSTILFNFTETFNGGPTTRLNMWTNVNGAVIYTPLPGGGISTDYTKIGTPHYFIGANLFGGTEYRGSDVNTGASFWGKIILGNWRTTNYWSERVGSFTGYLEWDRSTGLLTQFTIDYNGAGDHLILLKTNAWETGIPFWNTVSSIESGTSYVLSIALPAFGAFLLFYVFSFIFFGLYNYTHVKHTRGLKQSVLPPWLKMIVLMTLLSVAIWIAVLYFLLPFLFSIGR